MAERPEHVKCILNPTVRSKAKTLCGRAGDGWTFAGIDHAYGAIKAGTRARPCGDCVKAAVAELGAGAHGSAAILEDGFLWGSVRVGVPLDPDITEVMVIEGHRIQPEGDLLDLVRRSMTPLSEDEHG